MGTRGTLFEPIYPDIRNRSVSFVTRQLYLVWSEVDPGIAPAGPRTLEKQFNVQKQGHRLETT